MAARILFFSRDFGSIKTLILPILNLQEDSKFDIKVYSYSQGQKLFSNYNIKTEILSSVNRESSIADFIQMLDKFHPDIVVMGSGPIGYDEDLTPEQELIQICRNKGIPTISILDAWGMYYIRFASKNSTELNNELFPDQLCVMDQVAYNDLIALNVNPSKLSITHNPWFDHIVSESKVKNAPISNESINKIVFISQPLSEFSKTRRWPVTQWQLFRGLIKSLEKSSDQKRFMLEVWPHQNEDIREWYSFVSNIHTKIKINIETYKNNMCFQGVNLVISAHSTLTYEALYFGVPCVCLTLSTEWPVIPITVKHGLTPMIKREEEMVRYLNEFDFIKKREEILQKKRTMTEKRIFFSDGMATLRVLDVIKRMV